MRLVLVLPRRTAPRSAPRDEAADGRRWLILAGLSLLAAIAGATAGTFLRVNLPDLERLDGYAPPEMTRLLAVDGSSLANFATEKRILLGPGEIPDSFRLALVASEDSRFFEHLGIDPVGALRVLWVAAKQRRVTQGASTLTMQLAGNLFLDRSERTIRRKLQEMYLALEIERRFSKPEILRMYANQVHFGHGLFGLEAAARYYFGKPARELTVGESATLVGLLPRPAGYSPLHDMKRATDRRNLVLRRMADEGYLSAAEADRIQAEPIVVSGRERPGESAAYFTEEVRRWLGETYGQSDLYRGGLVVSTTLDPRLQRIAEHAVATGLAALDARQNRGDDDAAPAQAALVALDPRSGEVLALVGGRDFEDSEYDRVMQARRQPGSLFKPFVYATALERGWTLSDTLFDEPTIFVTSRNPDPYQPENFTRRYYGEITLRTALEQSINIATVRLLGRVGPGPVIDTAQRLGVRGRLQPFPSLALGTFELTLLEVTSAYGAFANGGLWLEPHTIRDVRDRAERRIHVTRPRVTEGVSPQVAYVMNRALTGVIERGTGRKARAPLSGHTLAGKTGTTDGNTDAWFVGYSPRLVVGVWVGHDVPRSLGERETGAVAALPIWIEFMQEALATTPDAPFPVPAGITEVWIDAQTGQPIAPRAGCRDQLLEAYLSGSEPSTLCSPALHRKRTLPYPLQRFELNADGALILPRAELERLLADEPGLRHLRRRDELEVTTADVTRRVPILVVEADEVEPSATDPALTVEGRGTDGRPARVLRFPLGHR